METLEEVITSRPFKLNPHELAKATFLGSISAKSWAILIVYSAAVSYAIALLLKANAAFAILIFVLLTPLLLLSSYLRFAGRLARPSNKLFLLSQQVSISATEFTKSSEDGSESKVKLSSLYKAERQGKYTLIYISESQAFFVPDGIWENPDDEKRFHEILEAGVGGGTVQAR